ncbi:hypothetical protein [Pseudoalteromonas sp. Of7M-16]|uniref:hypothetical protein n=1 Tax=Pseudoalteromonas sp. Of7M-16 TaxID=2917756 RepID=UPI001EF4BB71|nr:hypothetical protein [Pseudoalteromonas sp. Of7M-16]MCG7549042.1 hypothetical protein [Pseudoalteromonas sp. Of7M-16]
MEASRLKNNGVSLVTVGGFISATPQFIVVPYSLLFTAAGLSIGVLGVILCGLYVIPKYTNSGVMIRKVTRNDLRDAYEFCKQTFTGRFSSFNDSKQWFKKNKNIYWIVESERSFGKFKKVEITGFFCILPVNKEGLKELNNGSADGANFRSEFVCKENEEPSAYYIGAIGAKGRLSKYATLNSMKTQLDNLLESNPKDVYTKPTTIDGLRLALKYGFEALEVKGEEVLDKLYVFKVNNTD